MSNFVREYTSGRTPLPCAHCNSDLKFATLVDRARGFGADAVATGHYARVERDPLTGRYLLKRGVDPAKDQSYFLFSLTQEQLARAVFPVGDRPKEAVREYARRRKLPVADKPDSQEICFIPDNDYAAFVTKHVPDAARGGPHPRRAGPRRRRPCGHPPLHGRAAQGAGPLLVAHRRADVRAGALKPVERQVVVGPKASLERTSLTASGVNWIAEEPATWRRVTAQIRHRHEAAPSAVRPLGAGCAEVLFDMPQIAVAPGQAVVFYDGDTVVGGGWID